MKMDILKPKNVDSYIANPAKEDRPSLEEQRKIIKSTNPKAEEEIWYRPAVLQLSRLACWI